MAGDLEDFLRRAAQRRAANEATKRQQQQEQERAEAPRARPEYTDRRAERNISRYEEDDDDVIVVADLVEQPEPRRTDFPQESRRTDFPGDSSRDAYYQRPVDQADEAMQSHVHDVFDHHVGSFDDSPGFTGADPEKVQTQKTAGEIIDLIRSPQGIRQALMLREIIDRPVERWK